VVKKIKLSKKIAAKAKKIKILISDVDGVLTDGCVYYSASGEELKKFSLKDGMGIERLRQLAGIETIFLTRENSSIVTQRAIKLKIENAFLGVKEKKEFIEKFAEEKKLKLEEIAYIGDDVNDLEAIKIIGLSACPSDSFYEIIKNVDYVCEAKGGNGAFREFAEILIEANKKKIKGKQNEKQN